MQILLTSTKAGPGRKVKQEQEGICRNHVQTFYPIYVYYTISRVILLVMNLSLVNFNIMFQHTAQLIMQNSQVPMQNEACSGMAKNESQPSKGPRQRPSDSP